MNEDQTALRLSVSKCKTFDDCNKKFYYTYILKLPRKDHDYFTFGKFIHKVLEDFHAEILNGNKDELHLIMAKVYKAALPEYKPKMTTEAQKEAYDMVDAYLKKISNEKAMIPSITSVEKTFSFNISDTVILNGMIDRIQKDPDGMLHVCDYKTVKNKKYIKNDFFQLLTYAYVLYNEDPTIEKVRGSYILLRHNFEYITKEFSREEIMAVKDKYEEYAKMIDEEKLYRPNPTYLCRFCDHVNICEQGRSITKMDDNVKHGQVVW